MGNSKKSPRKMGRPTAFRPEYVDKVYRLTLLGATDEEVAGHLGVAVSTVNNWKHSHPDFLEALRQGKLEADCDISDALYHRAKGYEYDEEVPIKVKEVKYDGGKRVSEVESVVTTTVHRVVPPDATSMIFWLKNRRTRDWRDKHELGVDVSDDLADALKLARERASRRS